MCDAETLLPTFWKPRSLPEAAAGPLPVRAVRLPGRLSRVELGEPGRLTVALQLREVRGLTASPLHRKEMRPERSEWRPLTSGSPG